MAAQGDEYERPPGADDATVAATGKLSEALEWVERARGRLYDFHQLIGRADALFEEAADALEAAGAADLAERVRREGIGRNVLAGRWTFQIVDEFDDLYYATVSELEAAARAQLLGGRRHVFEAEMKERRRTAGQPGHERRPDEAATRRPPAD
jgi:hypothetical protein